MTDLEPAPKRRRFTMDSEIVEMIELLNDLVNFVGLGTLELSLPRMAGAGMEASDGWLWLEPVITPWKPPRETMEFSLNELADRNLVRCTYQMISQNTARVRVYYLPVDVECGLVSRTAWDAKSHAQRIMDAIDASREGWEGGSVTEKLPLIGNEHIKLLKILEDLPSPDPRADASHIKDGNIRSLLDGVLRSGYIAGMMTKLPESRRKGIAAMLERELAPTKNIDSRLKEMFAPSGEVYYLNQQTWEVFQSPIYVKTVRGGIVAGESSGETILTLLLALILSTKDNYSQLPKEHTASKQSSFYELSTIPPVRRPRTPAPTITRKIYLSPSTLIIAHTSSISRWTSLFSTHTQPDSLKILTVSGLLSPLLPVQVIIRYDIVILPSSYFEQTQDRTSSTPAAGYQSPLTSIRWKRVILGEGIASKSIDYAGNLHTDARWLVARQLLESNDKTNLEKLGHVVRNVLRLEPWAPGKGVQASWNMYTKGFVHGRPAAVTCVGNILGQVVIRCDGLQNTVSKRTCGGVENRPELNITE